jgi:hypothetical protein
MFIFRERLKTNIRKDKKIGRNIYSYNIVEEKEFGKPHAIGERIEIEKKIYRIIAITKGNQLEDDINTYIDIEKVDKNYESSIKIMPVYDREGHEVIANKDGSYYTINKDGKKVREWDKDKKLIFGNTY